MPAITADDIQLKKPICLITKSSRLEVLDTVGAGFTTMKQFATEQDRSLKFTRDVPS